MEQKQTSIPKIIHYIWIGEKELPSNLFKIVDIEDIFPIERINKLFNLRIK